MKCPKCGADIPEGKFYCEKCGEALQIVPDYNPAEDITIGEEDNNIQNKDSSDASSGEQRSDRKQRFFYLLKKYGPFALVLSIAGIITYWTSYQSTFHQDAVTEVAEELESETEQLLEVPSLSLPPGTYGDSIDLVISHDQRSQGLIYYTTDGTVPDKENGIPYPQGGIPLNHTGNFEINAVCCNEKGIYSDIVTEEYQIQFKKPDLPSVSPDGGVFSEETTVTITQQKDCTIYYTWDSTDPTTESAVYTEPIVVPEGDYVLSVMAVNNKTGLVSDIYRVNLGYHP